MIMSSEFNTESLLYQFFLAYKGRLPYTKIVNILTYLKEQRKENANLISPFYNLLKWGVIVSDGECYYLSSPILLEGANYTLGININRLEAVEWGILAADYRPVGLSVFSNSTIPDDIDIPRFGFNTSLVLKNMPSLSAVINNICDNAVETDLKVPTEVYEPSSKKWLRYSSKSISGQEALFRYQPYLGRFFRYLFGHKGRIYPFEAGQVDKINTIKYFLRMKAGVNCWKIDGQTFSIIQDSPFPTLVEKVLTAESLFISGKLPAGRTYIISENTRRRLAHLLK